MDDSETAILETPNAARMYDYWLNGLHNTEADREAARAIERTNPGIRFAVRANRAFLRRVVTHLVTECDIDQFVDLGSGVPTVGNVHEIAQRINPNARVVYVDLEPVAVAASRALLESNDRAIVLQEDMRHAREILASQQLHDLLDLSRPVAVLAVSVLHFIPGRQPHELLATFREALAPGSYLALSHGSFDGLAGDVLDANAGVLGLYDQRASAEVQLRPKDEVRELFGDFEFVEPGLVQVWEWHPDDANGRDDRWCFYGGLARKP